MKKARFFLLIMVSCFSILLTSCISKISPNFNKPPEGKVLLKADISQVLSNTNFSPKIDGLKAENTEWYVIYENVTKGDGIQYETIDSTEMELILEKSSIYVVGLAKKNDQGWIEMIGVLGDPYLGVTCIPVSDDATEVIDLGRLIEDEGILRSETVSPDEFSRMLGYSKDMIQEFGKSDITFKNFLNPDINRNGVIDNSENLTWWITSLYDFKIDESAAEPVFESFRYVFWINRDYVLNTYGEDFAVNSINSEILNNDKDIATLTNLDTGEYLKPSFVHVEFDDYYQWYFDSSSPKNGTYRLDAMGSETRNTYSFYFEDLCFFDPTKDFEGLITPIYKSEVYSDGKIKNLSWDWKIHTTTGMKDVSEDIVRLLSNRMGYFMWFYFATKVQFFNGEVGPDTFELFIPEKVIDNPYEDQTVNLESSDYWVQPSPWDAMEVRGDYLMVGNTDVAFHIRYEYLETPHDFDPGHKGDPPTSENLNGIWYNLCYHSQNWNKNHTTLDEGDKWACISFDASSGRFEASWLFPFNRTDFDSRVALVGTFEISREDPHVIVLNPECGEPIYMYIEVHDTYFEAMVSESTPTEINRESEDYVIYSKYRYEVFLQDFHSPNSPKDFEGTWVYDGDQPPIGIPAKIKIQNVEIEDEDGNGYYDGSIYLYTHVEDITPYATGIFRVDVNDYSRIQIEIPGSETVEVQAFMTDNIMKVCVGGSTYLYRRPD